MEKSDEQLIAACRAGDEEAWSALVARYQKLIYTIPRRAGFPEEAAADVLQQVFVKLLENLDKIEQPAQIQAWLVTTARRETLQMLRRQKNSKQVSIDEETENAASFDLISGETLADDALLELERQHEVRRAVARLDERCRQLVYMLFYQDSIASYAEIARALGISEGSIGPTRARCLGKLLKTLHEAKS